MATRTFLSILALSLLLVPAVAKDDKEKKDAKPAVKEATSKEAKHELKIFEREFATEDIDFKIDAVLRLAKCVHKDVMDRLMKIAFKEKDPFIRAEAVLGLGNQVPYKDKIAKKLKRLFDVKKLDPLILTSLVKTIGKLEYTKYWEEIAKLLEHWDDDVVVACFVVLGEWKELRAHRHIQNFWNTYPEEGKW
ncbi:MAG: HEAT repeat domain-containing protein, partial [Planctomycetota bacterium]